MYIRHVPKPVGCLQWQGFSHEYSIGRKHLLNMPPQRFFRPLALLGCLERQRCPNPHNYDHCAGSPLCSHRQRHCGPFTTLQQLQIYLKNPSSSSDLISFIWLSKTWTPKLPSSWSAGTHGVHLGGLGQKAIPRPHGRFVLWIIAQQGKTIAIHIPLNDGNRVWDIWQKFAYYGMRNDPNLRNRMLQMSTGRYSLSDTVLPRFLGSVSFS